MNIIGKNLNVGDVVFDQATKEPVKINNKNLKTIVFGVVSYDLNIDEFIFGFFSANPIENILITINDIDLTVAYAINKDIFGKRLIFANNIGVYKVARNGHIGGNILLLKGKGEFPYTIDRNYEAEQYLDAFANSPKLTNIFTSEHRNLIKYTFGLEFETEAGYIPQELCYKYGLIPVRDGSISGIEYASIILDKTDGLERVCKYFDLLKEYTSFNKECSYHVHMGGFPVDHKSIFTLYHVWGVMNEELSELLPKLSFSTSQFKASRKDYCRRNPEIFLKFEDLYKYMAAGNARYAGSLEQPHPQDPDKRAKWQIRERYWAQSLIGMCFYKGPKTVEYRMLVPTYNYNKMIFWIYMFNAIMLYSEMLSSKIQKASFIPFYVYKNFLGIENMLRIVYPKDVADNMCDMIKQLKHVINCQSVSGDMIGANIEFEDSVINPGKFIIDRI